MTVRFYPSHGLVWGIWDKYNPSLVFSGTGKSQPEVTPFHFLVICVFRVCHAVMSVHCSLVVTCWERADLLALLYVLSCVLSLSHVVSWVRCGTWLYRFLIFAFFLTLLSFPLNGGPKGWYFLLTLNNNDRLFFSQSTTACPAHQLNTNHNAFKMFKTFEYME